MFRRVPPVVPVRSLAAVLGFALSAASLAGVPASATPGGPSAVPAASTAHPPAYVVEGSGRAGALPPGPYRQVSVGYALTAGLTYDGEVVTASSPEIDIAVPTPPPGEPDIVQVAAGDTRLLVLDAAGHVTVHGWVSHADRSRPTVPDAIAQTAFTQVATSAEHHLGLTTDGRVVGWGTASLRELEIPAEAANPDPADPVVQIDVGFAAAGALTRSGRLIVWGWNVATGSAEAFAGVEVADFSAGLSHVIAVDTDGNVHDHGTSSAGAIPQEVADADVVDVAAGYGPRSAAVTDDGQVYIWGSGEGTVPAARTDARPVSIQLDRYRAAITYRTLAPATPLLPDSVPADDYLIPDPDAWSETPDGVVHTWYRNGEYLGVLAGVQSSVQDVGAEYRIVSTATRSGYVTGEHTAASRVGLGRFRVSGTVTLAGPAQVGRTLTAQVTGTEPVADRVEYQWLRDGEEIAGATGAGHVLGADDAGHRISLRVRSVRGQYVDDVVTSDPTEPVAPAEFAAGAEVTVLGTPQVGRTLAAEVTGTEPVADRVEYQWLREDEEIAGATGVAHALTPDDLGRRISVRVTSLLPGYVDDVATADPTEPVAPAEFATAPDVSVAGVARTGQVLRAVTVVPAGAVSSEIQWLRDGAPVTGAVGETYRVSADDLGRRLAARLTVGAPGHAPAVADSPQTARVVPGAARLRVTGPARPLIGGRARIAVTGLVPGEVATIRFDGVRTARVTADSGGAASAVFALPSRRRTVPVSVVGSVADRVGSLRLVVGAKAARLRVVAPRATRPRARARVVVRRLVEGERVVVRVAGRRVGVVVADRRGVARLTVRAPARVGRYRVVATGAQADRVGRARLSVRR